MNPVSQAVRAGSELGVGRGLGAHAWKSCRPRITAPGGLLYFMGAFVAGTLLPGRAEANA